MVRKEPKTPASIRSITISAETAEILAPHLQDVALPGPDGLVFPNGADHPIAASSFWNNHFSSAQTASGVTCRFHDLRHSSVAMAKTSDVAVDASFDMVGDRCAIRALGFSPFEAVG